MTLDEAIKHCLDIADGQDKCADISVSEHAKERIRECAADHRQLAEWLGELRKAKRLLGEALRTLNDGSCNKDCRQCKWNENGCEMSCRFAWRYGDEVSALIGDGNNAE